MSITIHDVAKKAGVSTRTVSRVVNQQGEISAETRRRVQAVIDELGYRPNILARSLVNQRSHTLGVVTWGLDYYAPSRIVVGMERRARELGYSLFLNLVASPTDPGDQTILETLAAHRVDGIIWAVPEVGNNRDWFSKARLDDYPPVLGMNMRAHPVLPSISVDNQLGAQLAVQHLLQNGRRRIGILAGPPDWWEAQERLAGWQQALRLAGLEPRNEWVAAAEWSLESGAAAARTLLAQSPDLDAIFACSDDIALGAMQVLNEAGRQIPVDICLVGFDDIPQSAFYQPPLTTVRQPLIEIGVQAVDFLHQKIESRRTGAAAPDMRARIEKPILLVRSSSGTA